MTSLYEPASMIDRLPADQRAVLQLVLARGHSYDEIARMLSIDRAAVRQRALAALDALGPATEVSSQRRALITDYLLGQLPEQVSAEVRDHMAQSSGERAWARMVGSELSPLSASRLPDIPAGPLSEAAVSEPVRQSVVSAAAADRPADLAPAGPARPVSRLGGAILLGAVAAAAIAAILIFVVFGTGSSGSTHHATVQARRTASTHNAPARTTTTAGTTAASRTRSGARAVAQINLYFRHGKPGGIAEILKAGHRTGVFVYAAGLAPNAHGDAYAVWLYNSPRSAYRLGYVNPGVGANGRLETYGLLPASAGSYKQIVVALQHGSSNKLGEIVLRGTLKGVK